MNYWPTQAKVIQVDINGDRIGLTKPVAVCIEGDATLVADKILAQLSPQHGSVDRAAREDLIKDSKSSWAAELESMEHEADDPGTS